MKAPSAIFRAYDIRGVVGQDITAELAYLIGRAIGSEAHERGQRRVVVGRDGRLSGPQLLAELSRGLVASGREVVDIGEVPTPLLYFATHYLETGSGVMLTGSHNPPEYNGFKIVLDGETLAEQSIKDLCERIDQKDFVTGSGSVQQANVKAAYMDRIANDVTLTRRLKIVVDCGNGVESQFAPALLRRMGCDVTELFCEVDGHFPNHHPDPSQPENLRDLIVKVRETGADVGLAFDGDGDRLGVVDGQGNIIWPDRLMMLYAKELLAHHSGAQIVFDVKCTRHLGGVIANYGGQPLMWKSGHSLIKNKMRQTGALLGGELTGHFFFKDRWYGFDDGLYAAARLLEIIAADSRSVRDMFADFPDGVNTHELHIAFAEGEQMHFMQRLLTEGEFANAKVTCIDGLRADFPNGWGLVRASNTMPCLTLRFEGEDQKSLSAIQELFRAQLLKISPTLNLPF